MKRKRLFLLIALFILFGCTAKDKSIKLSFVYGITTLISMILPIIYISMVKKKSNWYLMLFVSVFVVNFGYFSLSTSSALQEALLANRISYLGSVFLPMSMLMILLDAIQYKYKKILPILLSIIGVFVLFVAASPGYLDIYYKEVSLSFVNGITVLDKVYGDWHILYLFYLVIYFGSMIGILIHAIIRKKIKSYLHSLVLLLAVFVNLAIWYLEQNVSINFEFLSVSYIISECFLILFCLMVEESERRNVITNTVPVVVEPEYLDCFVEGLKSLTPTEQLIYDYYVEGKSTKEVLELLNIKENTLKYHNKNIYSKLQVNSRKRLIEIAKEVNKLKCPHCQGHK